MDQCENCGENMVGDGYLVIYHCPDAEESRLSDDQYDLLKYGAPDEGIVYCEVDNEEV